MNAPDTNEQVSALVDGELRGPARSRVVDALYGSPELRCAWARFHLIGDAVRKVGPVPGAGTIAGNVNAALAAEPVVPFRPRPRRPWLAPLPGLAFAAAVAAVVVLVVSGLDDGGARPPPVVGAVPGGVAAAGAPPAVLDLAVPDPAVPAPAVPRPASAAAPPAGSEAARRRWSGAPDAEARLNVYLVNHNESAGDGVRGVLPYVRIVGYQPAAGDHR